MNSDSDEFNQDDGLLMSEELFLKNLFGASPDKGFDLLFRKYYNKLCSHSIRFVHSKSVAEDIVSEVFVLFWQNHVYQTIQSSFKAYLYISVRNRSVNYLKKEFLKESNEVDHDSILDLASSERPDDILLYQELIDKLDIIIRNLPPQARKAFQMSRLDGMKYFEIAKELNISSSAVEKLISRALAKIKSELS